MGRRKTAKHAQRGTGFDPEVLSLCRPTRGGGLSDCRWYWKEGRSLFVGDVADRRTVSD